MDVSLVAFSFAFNDFVLRLCFICVSFSLIFILILHFSFVFLLLFSFFICCIIFYIYICRGKLSK
ncbi:hypothetical protein DW701_01215 [Bacteroides eggerthii]|uniref:Uncharacterized protein n=1 Tax=Bacteroides eggerthii TaxID=28111 RepID=A0A414MLA1_9BACE|nr:hypothetical protein DWX01_03025 [Bacteroides eggerthii]RHF12868.1 hypothetical protein DW701_01215 [Bacteroides eggerthii]RHH25122.1 hypothetical protein DW218_00865 [Bacteroides eggerthii]